MTRRRLLAGAASCLTAAAALKFVSDAASKDALADPERGFSWVRGELVLDGLSIAEAAAIFNGFN